jgi:hypothetical protein
MTIENNQYAVLSTQNLISLRNIANLFGLFWMVSRQVISNSFNIGRKLLLEFDWINSKNQLTIVAEVKDL